MLVVIDRLPFSRPDDPLAQARREAAERAGGSGFRDVDLPAAALVLAQGAGRLVRSRQDRGVVAVLDRRLATAGYRDALLDALPPMRRVIDPQVVHAFLADVTTGSPERRRARLEEARDRVDDRGRLLGAFELDRDAHDGLHSARRSPSPTPPRRAPRTREPAGTGAMNRALSMP